MAQAELQVASVVRIMLALIISIMLPGHGQCYKLIYEEGNNDILLSINLTSLGPAVTAIRDMTNFIHNDKSVRRFFEGKSGLDHVVFALGKEAEQDARLTIDLVDNLVNSADLPIDHRIETRSFDALGTIESWITGVPSPSDKRMFKKAINDIQSALQIQDEFNDKVIEGVNVTHALLNRTNMIVSNLTYRVNDNLRRIRMNKLNDDAEINMKALLTSLNVMNKNARSITNRGQHMLSFARLGFLTPSVISQKKLGRLVEKIQLKNEHLAPLFGTSEINRYYSNKLTTVHFDGQFMNFRVHIPLVDYSDHITIRPLYKHEKELSFNDIYGMDYLAISIQKRAYTFISSSDLFAMPRVGGNFISTQRRCEILSHKAICGSYNCESEAVPGLGDFVVHSLQGATFIIKIRHPVTANLLCNNSSKRIELNMTTLLTIPHDCQLESDYFKIYASPPSKVILPEEKTTFMIHTRHPLLKELHSLNGSDSESHQSWRALIRANNKDLKKLGTINNELEEKNELFRDKVSSIEAGYEWITTWVASGGGTIALVVMVVALCLCICVCRNRDTLALCCI